MLVLSRKQGERVAINGVLVVEVLGIHGNRVKLGFQGPKDVSVHREEASRTRDKKGKLETSVHGLSSCQEDLRARKQFEEYLSSGNYQEAYNMAKIYPNLPNREDLLKLTIGLGDKLREYEGD